MSTSEPPDQTGWKSTLSFCSDIFGIIGGVVLLAGLAFAVFGFFSFTAVVGLVCAGVAFLTQGIFVHVFIKQRHQNLQEIGITGIVPSDKLLPDNTLPQPADAELAKRFEGKRQQAKSQKAQLDDLRHHNETLKQLLETTTDRANSLQSDLTKAETANTRAQGDLEAQNKELDRLNIALSNEKYLAGVARKGLEQKGGELVHVKEQLAIEKAKTNSYEETNERLGRFNKRYEWLTKLADTQKAAIDEYVSLTRVEFCYKQKVNGVWVAIFGVDITNNSVLDVCLSKELDGLIKFEGLELRERKQVISPMDNVPPSGTRTLTLEQRLSDIEVKSIEDQKFADRANFEFEDLILTIIGSGRTPDVVAKTLKIPKNTVSSAFPPEELNILNRAERIRALSEILGSAIQLYEPLRISSNEPLPESVIESWHSRTMKSLEKAYKERAKIVFEEISNKTPCPNEGSAQGAWLRGCIVVLGDLASKETGKYLKQYSPKFVIGNTNNS
jgi:hypothetical protein